MPVPIDRTKQAVDPYALALLTARHGVAWQPYVRPVRVGLRGLGLLLPSGSTPPYQPSPTSDSGSSVIDDVLSTVVSIFTSVEQAIDIGNAADKAQQLLDQLNTRYQQLKSASQLSSSIIGQYQQAASRVVTQFCSYVNQSGSAAATAACQQIQNSGNWMIQSWELDKTTLPVLSGMLSGNTLLILGAVAVFLLFRRR